MPEESKVTIIEALKGLKLIEKRMLSNDEAITRYASMVSTERPYFKDEAEQKKEVLKLVQSNKDHFKNYLNLKRRLEQTNLSITVEMDGKKYTISDLLAIKRRMGKFMLNTYNSLNDSAAASRMRHAPADGEGKRPQVIRLYDEKDKNEALAVWQNLYDNISARLEVINATTNIVD
ncbi:MAG: hypothetical protein KAS32_00380 [Candidatus Peribacteraceae bacterium]|nr:hypothetical protein [Candidatus Peribacteraceae bacterium]